MMDILLAVMRFSSKFELNTKHSDKIPIVQTLIIISMFSILQEVQHFCKLVSLYFTKIAMNKLRFSISTWLYFVKYPKAVLKSCFRESPGDSMVLTEFDPGNLSVENCLADFLGSSLF